jgi:class 3 adenylate cyclase
MNVWIEWTDEDGIPRTLPVKDRVFIGRSCHGLPDEKKILLCAPQVSKDHAVITLADERLSICDSSRNGTFVNGLRVTSGIESGLHDGDRVLVGPCEMRVRVQSVVSRAGSVTPEDATFVASAEVWMTHLVADVRGYSTLSQKVDSSMLQAAMKKIFDGMGRIVQSHRGLVRNYLGDAIFAVWEHGSVEKAERALAACEAAVAQCRALDGILSGLPEEHGELRRIKMGWGMSTGSVTLSQFGEKKDNPAVVGDSTNLAFRLSDQANKDLPAPIVICERTARLVEDRMTVRELGRVETKGRKGLERVFGLEM